jgi:hypothetical protein
MSRTHTTHVNTAIQIAPEQQHHAPHCRHMQDKHAASILQAYFKNLLLLLNCLPPAHGVVCFDQRFDLPESQPSNRRGAACAGHAPTPPIPPPNPATYIHQAA